MIYKIQPIVYSGMRRAAGLTQIELEQASGLSRRTIQRIETGVRPPTREEEKAIRQATECSRLLFAELLCKALSTVLGVRVAIDASDAAGYRAGTPEAEANELLLAAGEKMSTRQWWAWKERLGRIRALGLLLEQEILAFIRDLRAELKDPRRRKKKPENGPDSA